MYYVRLTTVASIMGVKTGWLRGLVGQCVMDDEREVRTKGAPHIMHVRQVFQAIVAKKMRRRNIGYDLIRSAVDKFEIDRKARHVVPVDTGIDLVLRKPTLIMEARNILKRANDAEFGTNGEEQAA